VLPGGMIRPRRGGPAMHRDDVDSTLIHSIDYDEERRVLVIQFQDDGAYQYFDVGPEVVEELLDAESKGRYFNDFIRDTYQYRRMYGV
jgi:hypothetical protein